MVPSGRLTSNPIHGTGFDLDHLPSFVAVAANNTMDVSYRKLHASSVEMMPPRIDQR
jgi:hypothetical protein